MRTSPTFPPRPGAARRGIALITVLFLLVAVLGLSSAFLIRASFHSFSSTRTCLSLQAFYVAQAGVRLKCKEFERVLRIKNDVAATVAFLNAENLDASGNSRDFAITDASGTVAGYYSLPRIVVDQPHLADAAGAFTGSGGPAYQSVTITAVGSTLPSDMTSRVTRRVNESYNVGMATADVFSFSYVQNNWAWWGGFAPGQANVLGNTGSNGFYSVLSGTVKVQGGPALTYSGDGVTYAQHAFVGEEVTGAGTFHVQNDAVLENFPQMSFPRNLGSIADPNGPYVAQARALAQQGSGNGTVTVQTVRVTAVARGAQPMQYEVISSSQVVSGGVYGLQAGQNPNLVLGTLSATRNGEAVSLGSSNPPREGDVMQVVDITGMVVVTGNVAVQGYWTGRGSLMAGRNVYVSGDILYARPPSTYPNQAGAPCASAPTPDGSAGGAGSPATGDYTADQLLLAAGKSIVQGDVTSSSWWNSDVGPWVQYRDPTTGQYLNDGREDTGVDGVVNTQDPREGDGRWTVAIRNTATGQVQMADLTLSNGPGGIPTPQVPSGYEVVPGTGEDVDSDGRYTPPADYNRDFNFASRVDDNGTWSRQTFSSGNFDNFPAGVSGYSDSRYQRDVHRIDAFLLANRAILGQCGNVSGRTRGNVIVFGGEASRADGNIIYLESGNKFNLYQDTRFQVDSNSAAASNLGVPLTPRIVYAGWSQQ